MTERPKNGERVVLVHLSLLGQQSDTSLEEFGELAASAGVDVVARVVGRHQSPSPKYFVGSGKAEAIRDAVATFGADVVLFNHSLSPAQERNLERLLQCRVLDRTGVILDIFAQRARSFEGKLQVELAQLQHLSTRLVRGWTHLERQKGGIGLRGPGETQLETDRRLVRNRIQQIHQRLDKVCRRREFARQSRHKANLSTVSLVGYTNAGKSTLFNRLTGSAVYAADRLFATLDPSLRRIRVSVPGTVILSDTVGFIRDLPHELVAAFRATLEEVREADLLLHVIDSSAGCKHVQVQAVASVIAEIGAPDVPLIEVYNKIDLTGDPDPRIQRDIHGQVQRVWVSAANGAGLDMLGQAITERLRHHCVRSRVRLPATAGRLRARLYALGVVKDEIVDNGGSWVQVELPPGYLEHLWRSEGLDLEGPMQH